MKCKYKEDPIYLLYKSLLEGFKDRVKNDYSSYEDIDDILKLILLNNGCKIADGVTPKQKCIDMVNDDYIICFITGILGNDANEYYEYTVFNGTKYLIIFLDYFDIVTSNNESSTFIIGNSILYDAIKNLVEIFYITNYSVSNGILRTAFGTTMRNNQTIIAINILNHFKDIDGDDVYDVLPDQIELILSKDIQLQLYGIRNI